MPVSTPMKTALAMCRITPQEKQRLEELAAQRNVTLSYALREGARLYLEDAGRVASGGRSFDPTP